MKPVHRSGVSAQAEVLAAAVAVSGTSAAARTVGNKAVYAKADRQAQLFMPSLMGIESCLPSSGTSSGRFSPDFRANKGPEFTVDYSANWKRSCCAYSGGKNGRKQTHLATFSSSLG
jgi:hypothetical protein